MYFPRLLNKILVTWFGLGRVPVAPGTAGSLGAVPLCWALSAYTPFGFRLAVTLGVTAIAILSSAQDQTYPESPRDPSYVVIDEVAGMLCTTLFIGRPDQTHLWIIVWIGFVLFRILDVLKPIPANLFDRASKTAKSAFNRGACIVLDDVIAGLYGALILAGIIYYFKL